MHCTRSHIVEGRQHHVVDRVGWIRDRIPWALLWGMGTTDVPRNAAHCLRALPGSSLRGIAILQEYSIIYNNYYFIYTEKFRWNTFSNSWSVWFLELTCNRIVVSSVLFPNPSHGGRKSILYAISGWPYVFAHLFAALHLLELINLFETCVKVTGWGNISLSMLSLTPL